MPKPLTKIERNREHDARRRQAKPTRGECMVDDAVIARLFDRVIPEPNTGCLLWTGSATPHGYGVLSVGGRAGKPLYTHRIAYAIEHGTCDGQVLHRCDAPRCCNPDHLFIGTPRDNSDDKVAKGRQAKGAAITNAKLNADAVRCIRRDGRSLSRIAADYGVDPKQIHRVKRGEAWAHVEG